MPSNFLSKTCSFYRYFFWVVAGLIRFNENKKRDNSWDKAISFISYLENR